MNNSINFKLAVRAKTFAKNREELSDDENEDDLEESEPAQ